MQVSRPIMPPSYGLEPPGEDHALLPWSWVETRLAEARNYWLVTSSSKCQPHAIPLWGIWQDRGLLFSTSRASRKAVNLRHNPQAAVHLESGDEVVVMEGSVVPLSGDRWKEYVARYQEKYGIRLDLDEETLHFRFVPSKVLAWQEAAFPSSATRWTFSGAPGKDVA